MLFNIIRDTRVYKQEDLWNYQPLLEDKMVQALTSLL